MAEMLAFADSPWLRLNMDTGDTYIVGQDRFDFMGRFRSLVNHVHIKDVSPSLAWLRETLQSGI
jgi:inosose dehydratase